MLDRRIELFAPVVTQNDSGQVVRTFATQGSCYAELMVLENSGAEAFVADQMQSSAVVFWRVRYRTDIKGSWEFTHSADTNEVVSALPEGRKRYTIIKAKIKDNG